MLRTFTLNRVVPLLSPQVQCDPLSCLCILPRFVCDRKVLRLESYEKEREKWFPRVKNIDSFWNRLSTLQESGQVFEGDLKMSWTLTQTKHLPIIIELTEKFIASEKDQSKFCAFKFGPVMMRACHLLNEPDAALKIFNSQVLHNQLDSWPSISVLMDLLIKNNRAQEAAYVYEHIQKNEWFFIVRSPIISTLYAVALYKQGTVEAYKKASGLISSLALPSVQKQRIKNIVALFAIVMGEPEHALHLVKAGNSELNWNIKIQALTLLSDWKNVFGEIRQRKDYKLYKDTLDLIEMHHKQSSDLTSINTTAEEQAMALVSLQGDEGRVKRPYY